MLNARARRHAIAVLRRALLSAILFSVGLALALGLGAPDPGVAEVSYAAAMGVVAWGSALAIVLRSGAHAADERRMGTHMRPSRHLWTSGAGQALGDSTDPVVLERSELERDLRLGRVTMEDFDLLLRHRLERLAVARCSRLGRSPDELPMVGGDQDRSSERTAPGVPTSEVESFVGRLERMT